MEKYTILKGDTSLSLVARDKGWNWDDVLSLNEGVDLDNTQVGQVINVPSTAAPTETQGVSDVNVVNENEELENIIAPAPTIVGEINPEIPAPKSIIPVADTNVETGNVESGESSWGKELLTIPKRIGEGISSTVKRLKEIEKIELFPGSQASFVAGSSGGEETGAERKKFGLPDLSGGLDIKLPNIFGEGEVFGKEGAGAKALEKIKGVGTKVETFMKSPGGTALAGAAVFAGAAMQSKAIDKSLDKISGSIEDVKSAKVENIKGVTKSVDLITDTYAEERRLAGGTAAEDLRMALDTLTSSAGRTGGLKSGSIIEQQEDITTSVEDSMGIFTEQQRAKSEAAVDELRITGRQEGERMTSAIESLEQQAGELKTQKKKGWLDAGVSLVGMVNPAVGTALKLGMTAYDAYNA